MLRDDMCSVVLISFICVNLVNNFYQQAIVTFSKILSKYFLQMDFCLCDKFDGTMINYKIIYYYKNVENI